MNNFKHDIMMSLQPYINKSFTIEVQKEMSQAVLGVFSQYATPDIKVIGVDAKVDPDKRVVFNVQISVRTNIHL